MIFSHAKFRLDDKVKLWNGEVFLRQRPLLERGNGDTHKSRERGFQSICLPFCPHSDSILVEEQIKA